MPDISSELQIIATSKYGNSVKQAIYDALVKVNNAKVPKRDPFIVGMAILKTNGSTDYIVGDAEYREVE